MLHPPPFGLVLCIRRALIKFLPERQKENIAMSAVEQVLTGTVKWFNSIKGYGFIVQEDGTDIFVHHSGVLGEHKKGLQNLKEGDSVEYQVGQHEKGPMAVSVRTLEGERSPETE